MKTIGVGVEGPSDLQFWNKVLPKHFPHWRFDVRMMKNRDKLIRETPKLLDTFRSLHYRAGFILVDLDDDPCVTHIVSLFDPVIQQHRKNFERDSRFLHICVTKKELEAWFLADAQAIHAVIQGSDYQAPADTSTYGKGKLRRHIRAMEGRRAAFNEIAFARDIAPKFSPNRARKCSNSFEYFWGILEHFAQ